jgi:hypothetical protein
VFSQTCSSFLTKGYRWQCSYLLFLAGGAVVDVIVETVFAFTGRIGTLISNEAVGAIISSFNGVLLSVFYYELRVAKEGIDIDKIASVFD